MAFLGKEYAFVKQENFEDFVNSLGFTPEQATGYINYHPNQKLVQNGAQYTLVTITPTNKKELTFTPGVTFDEKLDDGTSKTTFTLDGNKLTQTQTFEDGSTFNTVRVYSDSELVETITGNQYKGTAYRYYKLVIFDTVAFKGDIKTVNMSFLGKEYHFVKQENFEDFLRFIRVPEDKFAAILSFTPASKFVKDGDTYTYHTKHPDGPKAVSFKSGVQFDDVIGPQKMAIKNTYVVDGDTVTQTMVSEKGKGVFKREYSGDEMVLTITAEGWDGAAKRYYKA
ncbi:uncharacterized protein LOC142981893 [Anticarsia gemmatalis]|uniref:uncharacterized protein LOC142981893 n=1 Tax=Anticarsia gemmatalis TaxID=129554 RepID=UPI003F76E718